MFTSRNDRHEQTTACISLGNQKSPRNQRRKPCKVDSVDSTILLHSKSFSKSFQHNLQRDEISSFRASPKILTFRILNAKDANILWLQQGERLNIHRPILMCFICKLSFSATNSFTIHADRKHSINLQGLEKCLLFQRKYASAIIQENMEELPQISFLEPDISETLTFVPITDDSVGDISNDNQDTHASTANMHNKGFQVPLNSELLKSQIDCTGRISNFIKMSCKSVSSTYRDGISSDAATSSVPLNNNTTPHNIEELPAKCTDEKNEPYDVPLHVNSLHASTSLYVLSSEQNSRCVKLISDLLQKQRVSVQMQRAVHTSPKDYFSILQNMCPFHKIHKGVDCRNCDMADVLKLVKESQRMTSLNTGNCALSTYGLLAVANQLSLTPKKNSKLQPNINNTTIGQPNVPSLTIGACSDHINGRPVEVECTRCEMILNTARLSAYPSARNSCKTLKCPQCNWHYKYQETLEIHMREKHPNGEPACGYCLAGQQHPRLARGESYSCGYKPYRCEICNYSTTTKGNLSIHMQSDKHLNNVHEINCSQNITATTSNNCVSTLDTTDTTYAKHHDISRGTSSGCDGEHGLAIASGIFAKPIETSHNSIDCINKQKPTFRCDLCSYETTFARNLRIHMTSEKHVNNLTILQNNIKSMQAFTFLKNQQNLTVENQHLNFVNASQLFGIENTQPLIMQILTQSSASERQKGSFFRPNMTNSKLNFEFRTNVFESNKVSHAYFSKKHNEILSKSPPPANLHTSALWPSTLFSCLICNIYNTNHIDDLTCHLLTHGSDQLPSHSESLQPHGSENTDNVSYCQNILLSECGKAAIKQYNRRLCNNKNTSEEKFQLLCKTDKNLEKTSSINRGQGDVFLNESKLECIESAQDYNVNVVRIKCNCCDFSANSIELLSLHVKQARHETMKVIFQHTNRLFVNTEEDKKICRDNRSLKQDIQYNELVNNEEPNVYLHCELCNVEVKSWTEMINHVKGLHHEKNDFADEFGSRNTFKISEGPDRPCKSSASNTMPKSCTFFGFKCSDCPFISLLRTEAELHILSCHPQTYSTDIISIPLQDQPLNFNFASNFSNDLSSLHFLYPEKTQRVSMLKSDIILGKDIDETETSQHEPEPQAKCKKTQLPTGVQCPLCQQHFEDSNRLELHLSGEHCVSKNALDRLLILLHSAGSHLKGLLPQSDIDIKEEMPSDERQRKKHCHNMKFRARTHELIYCHQCGSGFKQEQQLLFHAQKMQHFLFQHGEYVCLAFNSPIWQCTARFSSITAMFDHYSEKHINIVISEKHAYKYRCTLCSLAFKTLDKLEAHIVYHSMRDATKCGICARHFRSRRALEVHIEQSHKDKVFDTTDIRETPSTSHTTKKTLPPETIVKNENRNHICVIDNESAAEKSPGSSMCESLSSLTPPLGSLEESSVSQKTEASSCLEATGNSAGINEGRNVKQIEAIDESSDFFANPVDIISMIQFNQLMSLNLAPPLVLEGNMIGRQNAVCSTVTEEVSPEKNTAQMRRIEEGVFSNNMTRKHVQSPHYTEPSLQPSANTKRARTRISDDQLKILRSHFDINNSPSEDSIINMSQTANLPVKVVKHWFRNTLFKERQKNKDSPYNFNNPPSTTFDLDVYERTCQTNASLVLPNNNESPRKSPGISVAQKYVHKIKQKSLEDDIAENKLLESLPSSTNYDVANLKPMADAKANIPISDINLPCYSLFPKQDHYSLAHNLNVSREFNLPSEGNRLGTLDFPIIPSDSSRINYDCGLEKTACDEASSVSIPGCVVDQHLSVNLSEFYNQQLESLASSKMGPPKKYQTSSTASTCSSVLERATTVSPCNPNRSPGSKFLEKQSRSPQYDVNSNSPHPSPSSAGKRANRTRFTDYQIKVLQEFFENNSYPKDSDLEYLSKLLLLSPRVIVVWFQNARQKQRKIYENQPSNSLVESEEKKTSISYSCKRCNLTFQRYYELIRHQKNHCFKEDSNQKSVKAQIAAAQVAHSISSEDSNSSLDIHNAATTSACTQYYSLRRSPTPNVSKNSPPLIEQSSVVSVSDYDGCNDLLNYAFKICLTYLTPAEFLRWHHIGKLDNENGLLFPKSIENATNGPCDILFGTINLPFKLRCAKFVYGCKASAKNRKSAITLLLRQTRRYSHLNDAPLKLTTFSGLCGKTLTSLITEDKNSTRPPLLLNEGYYHSWCGTYISQVILSNRETSKWKGHVIIFRYVKTHKRRVGPSLDTNTRQKYQLNFLRKFLKFLPQKGAGKYRHYPKYERNKDALSQDYLQLIISCRKT